MSNKKKLTDKQELFCQEYIIDLNARQAAIRAGYSEASAKEIASENLTKPNIQERIAELKASRSKKISIDQNDVLQELSSIGFSNIVDVLDIDETGDVFLKNGKSLKDLPRGITALIQEIKPTKEGLHIKLYSKMEAIKLLMVHLGMNEKDNEQKRSQVTVFELPSNNRK